LKAIILLTTTLLTGCITVAKPLPPFPPAGPKQASASHLANPHCVYRCTVTFGVEIAEDNAGGTVSQTESQATTQTESTSVGVGEKTPVPI
jgi:hypothetical protein